MVSKDIKIVSKKLIREKFEQSNYCKIVCIIDGMVLGFSKIKSHVKQNQFLYNILLIFLD